MDSTEGLGGAVRVSFELIDHESGRLITKIGTDRVFARDTIHAFRLKHRLVSLAGRNVVVRPNVGGFNDKDMKFEFVHVHTLHRDTVQNAAVLKSASTTMVATIPASFAVHPNYPNPFNPSTQIKYDLPEASHVSLAVYDVLGRNVAELVNGHVAEGYHTVTWNAADQASGVYFARFTATDADGNSKLNKVSKLVLAR